MSAPTKMGNFNVTPKPGGRVDIECAKCGMGIEVGERFGPIRGEDLVAAFAAQHAHAMSVEVTA